MSRSDQWTTWLTAWIVAICAFASPCRADDEPKPPTAEQAAFFESKVRPVLVEQCQKCHGPDKQKSNLRLDSLSAALTGGDSGPAVVPGKPAESLLVTAISHEDNVLKMPPSKKLAAEHVADLRKWVEIGAPWPGGGPSAPTGATSTRKNGYQITDKDRAHWAFQPVGRAAAPPVKDAGWVRNPIDAFILAGLEAKGLKPNPPATKTELIRRAYYDLTGLPPSPSEVDAFLKDPSDRAYEAVIDHLLASPRYGEKWGRHWLDLVRFAETNSYERDNPKPSAWRYRDYVIRSFNNDKPYDRFVREQLAGDELPDGNQESLTGTGFYRLGIWDDEPTDRDQARFDGLDDIVTTTGQVFLGLTIDCARCHDHKIDPIPQKDYYRLVSFFRNINHFRNGGETDEVAIVEAGAEKMAADGIKELERKRKEAEESISELEKEFLQKYEAAERQGNRQGDIDVAVAIRKDGEKVLGPERFDRYRALRRQLARLKDQRVATSTILCVTESGRLAPETFILMRGNPHVPGDKVEPEFLSVLGSEKPVIPTPSPDAKTTGRRSALADWIVSTQNPLTSRVLANRLWQHHFGRGIVRSPNNFGTQGDKPTHPELLDWLASELIANGWQMKPIHRLIMTSNAYRMSSRPNAEALAKDPINDSFWRFDMRRLSAEEIRDSILAISGNLNLKMYGPGVYPEIPPEVMAGQSVPGKGWGRSSPTEQARRSIYAHVKRSLILPILDSYDLAETDRSTPVRFSTTQPTQALGMLNGRLLNEQARLFSKRLVREAGDDVTAQVRLALRLASAREPSEDEVRRGVELIASLRIEEKLDADAARKSFCLVVLNLNEFLYLD